MSSHFASIWASKMYPESTCCTGIHACASQAYSEHLQLMFGVGARLFQPRRSVCKLVASVLANVILATSSQRSITLICDILWLEFGLRRAPHLVSKWYTAVILETHRSESNFSTTRTFHVAISSVLNIFSIGLKILKALVLNFQNLQPDLKIITNSKSYVQKTVGWSMNY